MNRLNISFLLLIFWWITNQLTYVSEENEMDSLFSENTFRTHIVPRLLPLFCVRDVHIRLILLSHFSSYCSLFSEIQLQNRILPEVSFSFSHKRSKLKKSESCFLEIYFLKSKNVIFRIISVCCLLNATLQIYTPNAWTDWNKISYVGIF